MPRSSRPHSHPPSPPRIRRGNKQGTEQLRALTIVLATLLLAIAGTAVPGPVRAQELAIPAPATIPNFAGLAVGFAPDYIGANEYIVGPAPFARLGWSEWRSVTLVGNQLYANMVNHPILRAGPLGRLRFGRSDVEDNVVKKMEDISATVELGGYVGAEFINETDPRIRLITNISVTHDVGQVNNGLVVQGSINYWYPLAEFLTLGLATSVSYANGDWMETYFGVDNENSQRSGLPVYRAGGGIKDVWVGPYFLFHLSREWHVTTGVFYSRLLSDAADSPVVKDRGSANQFIGGAGFLYSW